MWGWYNISFWLVAWVFGCGWFVEYGDFACGFEFWLV